MSRISEHFIWFKHDTHNKRLVSSCEKNKNNSVKEISKTQLKKASHWHILKTIAISIE